MALAGLAISLYLAHRIYTFGDNLCSNDQAVVTVSPDGRRQAVTFRRNCGATTGYSTGVSILPTDRALPNAAGNILILNDQPAPTLRWLNDRHLSITGQTQTPHLQLTEFDGVTITYDTVQPVLQVH